MSKNVYVGNLSYDTSREQLLALFAPHGQVASVNVITDRATGRPRGFAFIEMTTEAAASAAIDALNGREVVGRCAGRLRACMPECVRLWEAGAVA